MQLKKKASPLEYDLNKEALLQCADGDLTLSQKKPLMKHITLPNFT